MALRSPVYLDIDTLLAQAEYHELEVQPQQAEVVEKTTRTRSGGGRLTFPGMGGADASKGTDVQYQSTYTLAPREKATVSRVIDSLIKSQAITINPTEDTVLSKDDLVEIDGSTRITAASLAGKMFYVFRRLMDATDGDPRSLFDAGIEDPDVLAALNEVYLQNELLPLPILLEVTGTALPQKVYVNIAPGHFVDAASANRLEGDYRILGSVAQLVPGGNEGYTSAERWLLHDWEHLLRRFMMTQVQDAIRGLFTPLDIDIPAEDVHAYIKGPAVVIDATAIY